MATILKEANFKGKNGSHFKIRLSYDLSQSQANNTSTIKYYLYMISMDGYSGSGATAKGYINGSQVGTFTSIGVNTTKQIGTKSTTVTHNNDGTKSVSYSASVDTPWSLGDASLSGTLTLPKINRLATVTNASDFTDEENPTLSFSNPAGFTVYPYLNFYDNNNNLVYQLYRNSETITSPYTWNITGEERSALWRATNKQQTYKVNVGVDTYNGTTKLGNNSKAQTMTYVNAEPSATYTLTEENAKVSALITSVSSIVENTSQIKVSVTPTALKEATIKNVILTNGANEISKSSSPYEYTFNIQSSNVFRIKVIDSRNNTKEYTITKTLINYQPVAINSFKFKRENPTSSNIYLTADITYYQTTFGTTTNAPTIKYKKGESGILRTLTASDYTLDNTNHKITITDKKLTDTLPYNQEQTFYLYVEDKLSTATDSRGVTKGIPTFDAGSHDFQVNGDLFVADINRQNPVNILDAINEIGNLFESLFYKNGDTWAVPDGYSIITGGHITSGKTEIGFSIYTPKSMKYINSVTVSNAKITVRQNGNYLIDDKIVNLKLEKRTDNCLYVRYISPSAITNATNNDALAVAFGHGTFTFSGTNVASDEESSDLEII